MTDTNDTLFPETDEMDTTLVLTDEDGNDVRFELLDRIVYEGETYLVLLDPEDTEGEVLILQADSSQDNEEYDNFLSVTDDDILTAVFELFKENNSDIFDFTD